ncbi:MAG: MFS transporter [Anaerolineaceae bacterium]|nr:MFS transporter [Anaerolineaceae bacterium]
MNTKNTNNSTLCYTFSMKFSKTFDAFSHRNFRLFFMGQLISILGSNMQSTAQGYLVYELTSSASYLGTVSFMYTVPSFLFMLVSGILLDHMERRRMMIITQTAMMLVAFSQTILIFSGIIAPWHILMFSFMLGTANAFDVPARQSITVDLVPREKMSNAIALNSMMFNLTLIIGPTAAAITYAAFGPAWCFLINAVTFLAIILALLLMKPTESKRQTVAIIKKQDNTQEKVSWYEELKSGFRYLKQDSTSLIILMGIIVLGFCFAGFVPLLPAWAVNVLGGDVRTNGWLVSARGIGALVGAMIIAAISHRKIRGILWTIGSIGMPITLIVFSFTRSLSASLAAIAVMGFFFIAMINNANALMQTRVPDDLRGRVMSIYSLCLFGSFSLGGLAMGWVAEGLGEPTTILISGIILSVFGLAVFSLYPEMRKLH